MKRELSNAERERMNQQIVDSCARTLWTLWWADQCSCGEYDYESCRTEGRAEADPKKHRELGALPGVELTEVAPPTPPDAFKKAEEILIAIAKRNKHVAPTILEIYLRVAAAPGGTSRSRPRVTSARAWPSRRSDTGWAGAMTTPSTGSRSPSRTISRTSWSETWRRRHAGRAS